MSEFFNPACEACRLHKDVTTVCVPGDGPDKKKGLMIIGEAPGRLEDARGIPFIGKAGTTLNNALLAAGSRREDVYVTNVVKCRPPRNRTPYTSESDVCGMNYLDLEIEYLKPKRILLLGNVPCDYLLGYSGITELRGEWLVGLHGIYVLPTFHPAALLYDSSKTPLFIQDVDEFVNGSYPYA